MKDYQPSSTAAATTATMESLPRVQRIRTIPIERITSPNNISNNDIPVNNIPPPIPKKLNEEERFRIHRDPVERKIVPGATFLPKIQHHNPNNPHSLRHHHSSTLADHHHHNNQRRFDDQQYTVTNSHPRYNLRTTPFGESLRHRNTPGSFNSEQHPSQPSAFGIRLFAKYDQDTGHSTASTPSASRPTQPFPGTSNRGGSLPTSHSINLPSYNYRIPMPSSRHHHSPVPSASSPHQQHRNHNHHHHPNHHQHIHDSEVPEIEASGLPQDPIIEAERQEPDYHLVESGSDILLSTKDDVPAPAPTSSGSTTNVGPKSGKLIPETDILDSSCSSDEDDDVVKNCDIEDAGNTRGMNRRFYLPFIIDYGCLSR